MPKDAHNKAAEHHETAAKSHRTAAEHHGKGDHAKGREESAIVPNGQPIELVASQSCEAKQSIGKFRRK